MYAKEKKDLRNERKNLDTHVGEDEDATWKLLKIKTKDTGLLG